MKKSFFLLLIAAVFLPVSVSAADGGGVIGEKITPFKPVFLSGEGVEFVPQGGDKTQCWVLAVFFQLPDGDLHEMEIMLGSTMGELGKVVFVSGAPEAVLRDHAALLPASLRDTNIAFDSGNNIARRVLPGNVVLPFAVLADCTGEIVWMGEPLEFADIFPSVAAGDYDNSKRKKAVQYYSELAAAIRTGNFPNVRKTAETILAAEPANPTAVQALMFFMEQSGDIAGAWQVLDQAMTESPESLFLAMQALNFGARHGEIAAGVLAKVKAENFISGTERQKLAAAFMLLNGYGFEIRAVDMAQQLLESVSVDTPEVLEFKALCAYRMGDLERAVTMQKTACNGAEVTDDMLQRLEFYETLFKRLQ